jgi:hypothetical protein
MNCCDLMGTAYCCSYREYNPTEVYILTIKTWEPNEGGAHQVTTTYVHATLASLFDSLGDGVYLKPGDSFEVDVHALRS